MLKIRPQLTTSLVVALLATQAASCSRADIILGALGGSPAPAASDPHGARGGASGSMEPVAAAGLAGHSGGSAGSHSGAAGSAGASGMRGVAGAAASAGTGGAAGGAAGSNAMQKRSRGCGLDPVSADMTIQLNGMTASYLLDLPTAYDKTRAYPLVIAFHEANTTADAFRSSLNLPAVTGADAIVVHPNCLNDAPSWDVQRDSLLFDALVSKLGLSYCVDQRRMFALGHGSGAMFVNLLGCVRGDQLRGIASLSGAPPPFGACAGETAAWLMQGNADPATVGAGRGNRDFWVAQNKCNGSMPVPVSPPPCFEYAGCDAGFPVRYCEYNGDETLPSFTTGSVWSFFKAL